MRKTYLLLSALALLWTLSAVAQQTPQIRGQYLETRSADGYVGQCFANGEVNSTGAEAIAAWHLQKRAWAAVPLTGLNVVVAINSPPPLCNPYDNPSPPHSVLPRPQPR